jgi:hypothetical protein
MQSAIASLIGLILEPDGILRCRAYSHGPQGKGSSLTATSSCQTLPAALSP